MYIGIHRKAGNIKSQQGMPNRKNTYTSLHAYNVIIYDFIILGTTITIISAI